MLDQTRLAQCKSSSLWQRLAIAGVVVVIFVIWMFATPICQTLGTICTTKSDSSADTINALFTGLALAGVVVTLWFQAQQARETEVAQREQQDVALLTAYLNALHALQSAAPPTDLLPHQAQAHRRIAAVVDAFHPKVLRLVSQMSDIPSVEVEIAGRLRKSIESIDREVNPPDGAGVQQNYETLIALRELPQKMFHRLETSMIGISPQELEKVRQSIEHLKWLESKQMRNTSTTVKGQSDAFQDYLAKVREHISLIKKLAATLDSSKVE